MPAATFQKKCCAGPSVFSWRTAGSSPNTFFVLFGGTSVRHRREQSHFKFGEINRLGSGGGTKPVNFFVGKNFSEIAKKNRAYGPKIRGGGPKIEKKGRFLA